MGMAIPAMANASRIMQRKSLITCSELTVGLISSQKYKPNTSALSPKSSSQTSGLGSANTWLAVLTGAF